MMLTYCLATFTHKRCLSYSGRYLPEYLPEDREHDKDNLHKRGIIYHSATVYTIYRQLRGTCKLPWKCSLYIFLADSHY